MKKVVLFVGILLLSLDLLAAGTGELSGHWTGSGTYQTEGMQKAFDANFDLTISQTSAALSIKDCWSFMDPNHCCPV